jgi:hypothetical protein
VVPKFKEAKITISLKAINERKMQNGEKNYLLVTLWRKDLY